MKEIDRGVRCVVCATWYATSMRKPGDRCGDLSCAPKLNRSCKGVVVPERQFDTLVVAVLALRDRFDYSSMLDTPLPQDAENFPKGFWPDKFWEKLGVAVRILNGRKP